MDRLDTMRIFLAAVDHGSLAGASRALSRSRAAVSRAIAALEAQAGAELLHRTTRALRLSETGERYATVCRRVLADLDAAEAELRDARAGPAGVLTVSAPPVLGNEILRPVLEAYLEAFPAVSARLLLLDRAVNAVEEGVDVALRVGVLPDSALVAARVGGGVRRVLVAAPRYLAGRPSIREPCDLLEHRIVAFSSFGPDSWAFSPPPGSTLPRRVQFKPRICVNTAEAAVASAVAGMGVTRLYSYHAAAAVAAGALQILLADAEPAPAPVHLLTPQGRSAAPKVRAFLDFAAPRLRAQFGRLAGESRALGEAVRPPHPRLAADRGVRLA
jgi:DNA-binding transcriptional LysR family regulator